MLIMENQGIFFGMLERIQFNVNVQFRPVKCVAILFKVKNLCQSSTAKGGYLSNDTKNSPPRSITKSRHAQCW